MGLRAYTGLPGSGKTYRIVSDLLDLSKSKKKRFIIHNIPALNKERFKHLEIRTIEEVCDSYGINETQFFSIEFQTKLAEYIHDKYNCQIVIVIDEAQTVLKDKNPAPWLTYHRHLNQDVWIGTQNLRNIEREVRNLVEFDIKGKKGPIFPFFIYTHRSENTVVSYSYKFKNREVFRAYKSFDIGKGATGTKSLWLPVFAMFALAVVGYTLYLKNRGFGFTPEKTPETVQARSRSAEKFESEPQTAPSSQITGRGLVAQVPEIAKVIRVQDRPLVWVGRVNGKYIFEDTEGLRTFDECFPGGAVLSANVIGRVITIATLDGQKKIITSGYIEIQENDGQGNILTKRIGDDWLWSNDKKGSRGNLKLKLAESVDQGETVIASSGGEP